MPPRSKRIEKTAKTLTDAKAKAKAAKEKPLAERRAAKKRVKRAGRKLRLLKTLESRAQAKMKGKKAEKGDKPAS